MTDDDRDSIYAQAVEITNSGDLDLIKSAMTAQEQLQLKNNFHTLIWGITNQSFELARAEQQELLHNASMRIAELRHFMAKQPSVEEFA